MISHANHNSVPADLDVINSPPPTAAAMACVISNHLKIAQSTSADSTLVCRSRHELERWRGNADVDAFFERLAEIEHSRVVRARILKLKTMFKRG